MIHPGVDLHTSTPNPFSPSISQTVRIMSEEDENEKNEAEEKVEVDEIVQDFADSRGRNLKKLCCPHCGDIVLRPGVAKFSKREVR